MTNQQVIRKVDNRRAPGLVPLLVSTALWFGASISALAQSAPYAHTHAAGPITTTNATLNGMALPNGSPSLAWFEWGPRGIYTSTSSPGDIGSGTFVVRVSQDINGLTNGGIYQCRLVVSNANGVQYGAVHWFRTAPIQKAAVWGGDPPYDYGQANVPRDLTNIVAVAGGAFHSLALQFDGTVRAWGQNTYGQTNVPAAATNVIGLGIGYGWITPLNLALRSDTTVVAWGTGATVPANLSNVVMVASGDYHSLAIKADGTAATWLNGPSPYFFSLTNLPISLTNVAAVGCGVNHSLALRADGTVVAWGYSEVQTYVPPGTTNVVAIAAGSYHNLALKANGTVAAWGQNGSGQANVPPGLTNVVAIAAGGFHSLALKADGTLVAWGLTNSGQTRVPSGLSNVVGIACGGFHSLALGGNVPPLARPQTNTSYPNCDQVITLSGSDANNDPLNLRVLTLPGAGSLYQYANGQRGAAITLPDTIVSDAARRVVFAPAPNSFGSPYATFSYLVNDGLADSPTATVTVNIALPPAPSISSTNSGWSLSIEGAFELNFTGNSNAAYSAYASTNLINWDRLGAATQISNGWFQFLDLGATNWPQRYYRAGAP